MSTGGEMRNCENGEVEKERLSGWAETECFDAVVVGRCGTINLRNCCFC